MPSGAKKRKAAKKKKEQAANNINPSTNNDPLGTLLFSFNFCSGFLFFDEFYLFLIESYLVLYMHVSFSSLFNLLEFNS